jgi:UDP-N-acetylglucosamine diphosphorylase / glucose-1-phosphate thymidylyltransferase / UDP-N-acetylgalactosamine diphosphorylase / glucosamine-1-phosphate N-acetyltransferase / galactosamine-1-phosphate N-acetyltransferase
MNIEKFIANFPKWMQIDMHWPWQIINNLENMVSNKIALLNHDYKIENEIAIHKTARIEPGAVLKGNIIIGAGCFIGANAYLRGPIFLDEFVTVGPGSEVKQSIILKNSAIAHFNYIGNSIIGENVNFEAGSVCANHYNERENKNIFVLFNQQKIDTQCIKFGALVGDNSKIGANAVLSPGTLLEKNSVVKRLELVEQIK